MDEQQREYYMRRRQTLIMELGALEDLLDMERSIVPKRKRIHTGTDDEFKHVSVSGYREPILSADS